MYCSNCGNQINEALKYCNVCGSKQKKGKDDGSAKSILDNLLTTLFLVVMFGLGILVGLTAVLLESGVSRETLAVIVISYLAAVFGICFVLLGQVKRVITADLGEKQHRSQTDYQVPPFQMPAPTTAQLQEHREPASVVEHTTRTLDEIRLARKS